MLYTIGFTVEPTRIHGLHTMRLLYRRMAIVYAAGGKNFVTLMSVYGRRSQVELPTPE